MGYAWHNIIGNIGVFLIVVCYFLNQIGKFGTEHLGYSAANGLGAIFIMISLGYEFNMSAFLIEFFWLLISLVGIVLWLRKHHKT